MLASALVIAACSGSSDETTTTTSAVPDSQVQDAETLEQEMCRTLALLSSVGANPPAAAIALLETDLDGATGQQMTAYGDLLIGAPVSACPAHIAYAEEIAYWLGF